VSLVFNRDKTRRKAKASITAAVLAGIHGIIPANGFVKYSLSILILACFYMPGHDKTLFYYQKTDFLHKKPVNCTIFLCMIYYKDRNLS